MLMDIDSDDEDKSDSPPSKVKCRCSDNVSLCTILRITLKTESTKTQGTTLSKDLRNIKK